MALSLDKSVFIVNVKMYMAEHKYIKLPKIKTVFNSKAEAIERTVRYINGNLNDFHDGESLLIRFYNNENESGKTEVVSARVFVNIDSGNTVSLSFGLDSKETIRVVETNGNPPEDTETLWLTDQIDHEDITVARLQNEIKHLKQEMCVLQEMVIKHQWSLTTDLGGGDLIKDSIKYEVANEAEQEAPIEINDTTFTTGDTEIVNFKLFYGNTDLEYYTTGGNLYRGQIYFITPKYYNAEEERVSDSGVTLVLESSNPIVETIPHKDKWIIFATTSAITKITATVTKPDGTELPPKEYTLNFKYDEEATRDYPNVKHLLVKTVDTYDILSGNTDYLLLNELVWCIGNNSLYLKAYGSNGRINLFKINGSGETPTPVVTTGITFEFDSNDVLDIEDQNEVQQIYVDDNGILHLVGYIDDDGILYLNDSGSESHSIDEQGNLVLNNIEIDDEGYLIFTNASVDEDGNLIMN